MASSRSPGTGSLPTSGLFVLIPPVIFILLLLTVLLIILILGDLLSSLSVFRINLAYLVLTLALGYLVSFAIPGFISAAICIRLFERQPTLIRPRFIIHTTLAASLTFGLYTGISTFTVLGLNWPSTLNMSLFCALTAAATYLISANIIWSLTPSLRLRAH